MAFPDKDLKDKVLFRGRSCFPLSPDTLGRNDDGVSGRDQTVHILQVLGKEQPLDEKFFYKSTMHEFYKQCLDKAKQKEQMTLEDIHDGVNPNFVSLLKKCLKLNYKDRSSVDQLLEHPIFEGIHDPKSAAVTQAPTPVEIRIDQIVVEDGKR